MATKTFTEPTADEQQQFIHNRVMRISNNEAIPVDQKFGLALIRFAEAVTENDYPDLKVALENIPGIQRVSLLIDGKTTEGIPEGKELWLYVEAQQRINPA